MTPRPDSASGAGGRGGEHASAPGASGSAASSRAAGALYGLAIGDALGMPTQSLPRALIIERYGEVLDGFHPAPEDQPLAAGMPAGAITDDTEQALLLARLVVSSGGEVDGRELAHKLVEWEDGMRARGSLDLLGPSTKRAIEELLQGKDIGETGRYGTTNGAAMRVTPVGIATPSTDLDLLLDRVVAASAVTHNTGLALSAAAAVAAAVSAGIDGATVAEATRLAIHAAGEASKRGHWVAGADLATRIAWATTLIDTAPGTTPPRPGAVSALLSDLVGTSLASQESVPAAFAVLAAFPGDPWPAVRLAASVGGDTDTIAAIAGAIAGACHGLDGFPTDARATVARVNGLRLEELAGQLLEVRSG
ncbi:ADP-ribosylglycohydrolase family protein [Kribbella sp. CA-293567]|uniref:ADP-ribosylglycohydrolase family protein n=1 Tax=Kribbella sp. CA-293567 TaxID=3002436 RepID=UPI0022DD392D|nr:ADP-ribosylglycohydrolase family protein [Kribbella sp. CA-293567]WBQ06276.1 ADP-ribosylglycohydrolase family protein [Kribbella sp. CA-293567]